MIDSMELLNQSISTMNAPVGSTYPGMNQQKFRTTDAEFQARVVQKNARDIFDFPAKTWEDAKQLNYLLASPKELQNDEEAIEKGAAIVRILYHQFEFQNLKL